MRKVVLLPKRASALEPAEYQRPAPPAFDGLAITWFHSTAGMKRGTLSKEYAITRADEPHFLPDGHLPIIITPEHEIDLAAMRG